eukprot:TRINITY_DN43620_c0_g1_i1.p1 TRINITY_DN43620_c0_g1~~TRINITY_DN43620_c0_g1_i1.p1  ORF type:complete len:149 (+),score=31.58 TRINITY_DN43620_c0_g1_i1:65-448(+)
MTGSFETAIEDFTTTAVLAPSHALSYFRRAFCYKSLGDVVGAAKDFQTAQALDPTNPLLVVNMNTIKDVDCLVLARPGDNGLPLETDVRKHTLPQVVIKRQEEVLATRNIVASSRILPSEESSDDED